MLTSNHRKLLVSELVAGIGVIGPDFERFGTIIVDQIVKKRMNHRGLTPRGIPVKSTVDSISDDGSTAAQYSAQTNYFDDPYKKLLDDKKLLQELHPNASELFLLSSCLCSPGAHTDLVGIAANEKTATGLDLVIYDSRRIAEYIVDELLIDDRVIDALSPYLATLEKVRTEYAATNLLPKTAKSYLARADVEEQLKRLINTEKVAILAGLSGTGKSQTAIAVANDLANNFEMVIWVNGKELSTIEDLQAHRVDRRNMGLNLSHLLKNRATLLILDDLFFAISSDDLKALCGDKSAILVTRQVAQQADLCMPFFSENEARKLLEDGTGSFCPAEVFQIVWKTVGGHALTLKLMNVAVRNGVWSDLPDDCKSIGELPDTERFQQLANRLLGRLLPLIKKELALFNWCESGRIDREFARRVIQPVGLRKLADTCLLAIDRNDVVRLHDVVFAVLPSLNIDKSVYDTDFNAKLDAHVNHLEFGAGSDLSFLNFVYIHHLKIEQLLKKNLRRGSCLFCLAHSWSGEQVNESLISDPIEWANDIAKSINPQDIDVSAVCEAIEAVYRYKKYVLSDLEEARKVIEKYLNCFDILADGANVSAHSRRTALHHKAKALRNLTQFDKAIELCEQLINEYPHPATKLLLARLLVFEDAKRAKDILFELLIRAANDHDNADISVTLAAIETLGRSQLKDYFPEAVKNFGDLLRKLIVDSAVRGFDQAYVSFASIGRYLKYHDATNFLKLLNELPRLSVEEARDDKEKAQWGHILLAASEAAPDEQTKYASEALVFYSAIAKPDQFTIQEKGHTCVILHKYQEAVDILTSEVSVRPNPWKLYWLAKALYGLHDYETALQRVNEALADPHPAGKGFHPGMYELRWEIRKSLGDQNAGEDLQLAYDSCKDKKHKAALKSKLSASI